MAFGKGDDSITKDLDELHKQARAARKLLEPEWFMCLGYFQNKQWLAWAGDKLHKPDLGGNRITVVENRIAGAVRTELAKMTKNRPVFVVTPNTGDEEDANAAQLSERLMRFMWRHLKMHEQALKALEWSRICGAGFLKCYWDSTIGDSVDVIVGPDGQVITDPQTGKPMRGDKNTAAMLSQQISAPVKSKRVAQGDIRVEVRSPFQMFVDPICDSFPDAEWVIEESVKSVEYVLRRFDVKLKADTPANPGLIEARMMGSSPMSGQGSYKGVKVREYWCKPSSEHPNGCRIVWAQGKVLDRDERPFDPMPYVMLTGIPVPGRLWPMGIVELLRGPQTELNKTLSQIKENANRIGNPTLLVSKQAIQDAEKFLESASQTGGAHFYDDVGSPNALPKYLEAPPLPEYVVDEVERVGKAIEDISGQHEVTNANVPPGVTAASAITLLQEADDTRLGLAIQDYEEQLGRFGNKVLELTANFYTDARTIKIGGDDGAWEIFDFRGSMLNGNTHVEVQAGSAFPQSLAMKQAQIKDLMTFFMESGNPPKGRQLAQFLRDSGMGATDRLVQEYTTTETQVNRENTLLALGKQLPINEYDDDEGHIDGHEEFERSARFQALPPPVQQIHLQHTAMHHQRLSQIQQARLEMQMRVSGTVDPSTSQAALQAEHELSQLQGAQDLQQKAQQGDLKASQQQQQTALQGQQSAQQQGFSQADNEMRQRHAQELHQQKLHHAEEAHRHQMSLAAEKARQQAQQAKKEPPRGR